MARKFTFTLQDALDQAKDEEDEWGRVLRQRLEDKETERQRLEMRLQQRDERRRDLDALRALPPHAIADFQLHGARDDALLAALNGCEEECAKQRKRLRNAELVVEAAREALANASVEYKQLERLKEKEQAEFHAEQLRREEAERDEAAILRRRPRAEDSDDGPQALG